MAVSLVFGGKNDPSIKRDRPTMKNRERSQYETLLDTMPVAAALIRARDGQIIFINDIALASLRLVRSKIVGETAPSLLVDTEHHANFAILFKGQDRVENFTTTLRRGDGAHVNVILSASRLSLDGETMLMSVFKDITPLVQTQTALREKGDTLKQVVSRKWWKFESGVISG